VRGTRPAAICYHQRLPILRNFDVYDGTFTAVIRMKHDGKNYVEIIGQDSAGYETRLQRSAFVEAF
jgi:hypothetical protein